MSTTERAALREAPDNDEIDPPPAHLCLRLGPLGPVGTALQGPHCLGIVARTVAWPWHIDGFLVPEAHRKIVGCWTPGERCLTRPRHG